MFILISLKTEIARSASGPKLQGLRAEDAKAKPYLELTIFCDLITADQQGPKRQLRISKQSSICSRGAGLSHPMDPGIFVQNQNFTRNPEKFAKFLEPRNLKSFTVTIPLEFGSACEDLSWNHCTSAPHRSETNGTAERAVRRVKEGTSAVLMQSGSE